MLGEERIELGEERTALVGATELRDDVTCGRRLEHAQDVVRGERPARQRVEGAVDEK